jgi:hypothetical protein
MIPAEQVFEEMLPFLEPLDAQIGGIIRLLKDKGITTNAEFAQNAQRGDDAGNVRSVDASKDGIFVLLGREAD